MDSRNSYTFALPVDLPAFGPDPNAQYRRVICTPTGSWWSALVTDQENPVAEDAYIADAQVPSAAPGGTMGYNVAANLRALNAAGNIDRARFLASAGDAQVAAQLGLLGSVARGQLFNGATWDRRRSLATDTDAQAAAQLGLAGAVMRPQIYNGTTFDRQRAPVSFNRIAATALGDTAIVAAVGGQRIRLLGCMFSITAEVAAAAAAVESVAIRDNITSAGIGASFFLPAVSVVTGFGAQTTGWMDLGPLGFLGGVGNALNVNLNTALTAGQIVVQIAYIQAVNA